MAAHPALPKRLLGYLLLLTGLASSFAAGIAVEVAELPGSSLIDVVTLLIAFIWTMTTVALTLGRSQQFWPSIVLGAFLGALAFMLFVIGTFLPFAAGWGHRKLDLYGGDDYTWQAWLFLMLQLAAWTGAAIGFGAGLSSWAFRSAGRALSRGDGRIG